MLQMIEAEKGFAAPRRLRVTDYQRLVRLAWGHLRALAGTTECCSPAEPSPITDEASCRSALDQALSWCCEQERKALDAASVGGWPADNPENNTQPAAPERDAPGEGKGSRKGNGRAPLRSWTQTDLDAAIHKYKAERAGSYRELVNGVQAGKPGAIKAAQKLFGRNALARALGVKAPAMISKSEAWREIAAELGLNRKAESHPRQGRARRMGTDIAFEEEAEKAGDTVAQQVDQNETIRLARQKLPKRLAEEIINRLIDGVITDDQARQQIDLTLEQIKDAKATRAHSSL
jgi:hypothetical protein